jgi:23S rRNA (pseudouridine1915-N3)-methyltransferase
LLCKFKQLSFQTIFILHFWRCKYLTIDKLDDLQNETAFSFGEREDKMKINIIQIDKTQEKWLLEGIENYVSRLKHYTDFTTTTIEIPKKNRQLSIPQQLTIEEKELDKYLNASDKVVLLDENGKQYTSMDFSNYIQKQLMQRVKSLTVVIGGPYGFSENIHKRGYEKISLSKMTFSHQMVRLFLVEQVYRAFSILNNEKYHHQ